MTALSEKSLKALLASVNVERTDSGFAITGSGAKTLHTALQNVEIDVGGITKGEFKISNEAIEGMSALSRGLQSRSEGMVITRR